MNRKIIVFVMVCLFVIYFFLRFFMPDIFWPKVKIINKVLIPQGYSLYVKDIKNNRFTEKRVPVELVEDYFDANNENVLYSTYGASKAASHENRILIYDYLTDQTRLFYSLNGKISQIFHARYFASSNMLILLYEKNNTTYLDCVDMKAEKNVQHIKIPFNEKVTYFDVNRNRVLLSIASQKFFHGYYSTFGKDAELKIYSLNLLDGSINTIDALGYNAIFNPNKPDEIFAMSANKQLFSFNIISKLKQYLGIKCIFVRAIVGTDSLLVVKPIGGDNFADIGVFDVVKKKYTRITGGWSAIYQAFYE
jgi:hypothetical protein